MRGRTPLFVPCTPKGCLEMLRRARLPVAGAACVVLGNSNTVGTPLSMLLRDCGASTVTVCHAAGGGPDDGRLASISRTADLLFAAVGRAGLVKASWVKPGATVVDVGINAVKAGPEAVDDEQWRVVGDVDYEAVAAVAGAITPVPGGVGPMTVAALLDNILHAWLRTEVGATYAAVKA